MIHYMIVKAVGTWMTLPLRDYIEGDEGGRSKPAFKAEWKRNKEKWAGVAREARGKPRERAFREVRGVWEEAVANVEDKGRAMRQGGGERPPGEQPRGN